MVKKYKRSEKLQLSKNFRLDEFKCKCGKCDPILVDEALVDWLQKIRDHFGRSVNINSGYRCAKHNADPKVGGNPGSHHMKGMAADIRVEGITPEEVAKYAESIGIQRIGLYTKKSFVHIGSGTTKKFWMNDSTNEVNTFGGKPKNVTIELPVLRRGMKCEEVETMQVLLNVRGKYQLDTDGSFGGDTDAKLKDYQRKHGIKDSEGCGKATWKMLLGCV